MRRMSMDRTVVKKNICRKKSDTRPTTAKRQNSWEHIHMYSLRSSFFFAIISMYQET